MEFEVITTEKGSGDNCKKYILKQDSSHFHYDINNSKKTKFE